MNKNFYIPVVALLFVASLTCASVNAPKTHGTKRTRNLDGVNWKNFMAQATRGTSELVKMATPYVVEKYPTANVSEVCTKSLVSYVDGIKQWKKWAIRMFDMTGKLPSSFKKGAGIEFGCYDDCVRIDVPSDEVPIPFIGQFCMVHLQASRPYLIEEDTPFKKYATQLVPSLESTKRVLNLYLGICVPSTCTEQDIYSIVTAFLKSTNVSASLSNCETKEPKEWLKPTKSALSVLAFLLGLCVIGTILDSTDGDDSEDNNGIFRHFLKAFSLGTNIPKIFGAESVSVEIRRICGVIFLLCIWIIACHTIIYPTLWKEMRYTTFRDISMAVWFADSFVVAMDAIFFASGFLSIFVLWRIAERSGGIIDLIKEFIRVYFRWSAVNAYIILFSFAFPLIYYGPLWHPTWNRELINCQNNGWLNLFNAQTQLPMNDRCWLHTWYPALGMQFFLASIPLLFLLYRSPKIGFAFGILLSAVIISTETTFSSETLDSLHYLEVIRVTVVKFYSNPLFYFLPYLLGILAGRLTIYFKEQEFSKKMSSLHIFGWILSIGICVSVLRDGNSSKLNLDQSSLDITIRTLYLCIAMCWIMYASIIDGVVGRILSSRAVFGFARVSYCAYMMHTLLITTREAALKERIYIAKLNLTIEATTHVTLSYLFGMFIHAMVEMPFAKLYDAYIGHNEEGDSLKGIKAECSSESSETSMVDQKKDS